MPQPLPTPTLIVEDLTCRYLTREEPTLQHISFSIQPGQIVLLSGSSGCGKTTLLRCINGLIPRSYRADLSGQILLQGHDMTGRPLAAISQVVGTVLQDPERQILGAYVRNEVAFGLENLGLPRDEVIARTEETLNYLGLSHLADRQTFLLSGGEKQKVALAGVLAMRPSLLVLDEPLANLDPASAQEALALIRRLADEGKTILIIEHRVEDVLAVRPDVALHMQDGVITYAGPVEGMLQSADYRAVKLPAPVVIERARREAIEVPPSPPVSPIRADAAPLITFEDVTFHYEGGPAILEDVNLTIRQGDVIAVLGPNGAGKTTLVKHAIGLLRPTHGRVLLRGQDTREMSVAQMARTVGYVFQSPRHMLFAPTVREELAFGPRNIGQAAAEIEENARQALATVNLSAEAGRPPLSLSFGQQKRVSIAAVLAMRSSVLVMDEPTAGQDYANYMSFMDAVVGLGSSEDRPYSFAAILFITHDVDLAVCYANRVLLLSDRRIAADGPPAEVLADFDRMRRCRVLPTSLLQANLEQYDRTGRFLRIEALAQAVAANGGRR